MGNGDATPPVEDAGHVIRGARHANLEQAQELRAHPPNDLGNRIVPPLIRHHDNGAARRERGDEIGQIAGQCTTPVGPVPAHPPVEPVSILAPLGPMAARISRTIAMILEATCRLTASWKAWSISTAQRTP